MKNDWKVMTSFSKGSVLFSMYILVNTYFLNYISFRMDFFQPKTISQFMARLKLWKLGINNKGFDAFDI